MNAEILIVGAGIYGVSTAYHLAKSSSHDASRITILDRAPAPSTNAASTDVSKIVRADYEDLFYMELAYEAMDAWKSLPFFKDSGVYHQTGWISFDEKGSDLTDRVRENFRKSSRKDVTYLMSAEEVKKSWGGLLEKADLSPFETYYFNPDVAWVDAGRAVEIMAAEAVKMGVRYEVGEVARVLEGERGGVKGVETTDGKVYGADKVVLCSGAWTSSIMASLEDELRLPEEKTIESQIYPAGVVVSHFQLSAEEKKVYDQLPIVIYGEQGELWPPTDSGLLKNAHAITFTNTITAKSGRPITVPAPGSQFDVPRKLQDLALQQVRARLPQILDGDRQVDYFRLCWDSVTHNKHPVITRHPDERLQNLYIAAGGSFHTWKFLPTIGKYVANVIDGVGNGSERDGLWAWKTTAPKRDRKELKEFY